MDDIESPSNLPCPQCGYNVITQVLGRSYRCPECGIDLSPIEAEPRSTLPARWEAAHADPHGTKRLFELLAGLNLVPLSVFLLVFLGNVTMRGIMIRFWWSGTGQSVYRQFICCWTLPVLVAGGTVIGAVAFGTKRCVLLGVLNALLALAVTYLAFQEIASL